MREGYGNVNLELFDDEANGDSSTKRSMQSFNDLFCHHAATTLIVATRVTQAAAEPVASCFKHVCLQNSETEREMWIQVLILLTRGQATEWCPSDIVMYREIRL